MRVCEIVLCAVSLITLILSFIKKVKFESYISLVVLVPLLIMHAITESIRWQMFGVYILAVCLMVLFVLSLIKKDNIKTPTFIKIVLLILVSITTVCILLFGGRSISEPNGEFLVGTMSYDLTDVERQELYNGMTDESRKFRIQIWYPTDRVQDCAQTYWLEDVAIPRSMIKIWIGTAPFLLDYATQIETNGYKNAELSSKLDSYPVVVISHGWMSTKSMHTNHAEMLASNGYIVINIDHTYGSLCTVYEDGTAAQIDVDALPPAEDNRYSSKLVGTYSSDAKLVLDHIFDLNDGFLDNPRIVIDSIDDDLDIFAEHIDTENIGVMGHSTGGGGMVKLAIGDDRVKAVFGFDPWVAPIGREMLSQGVDIPSLYIRSQAWEDGENNEYLQVLTAASCDAENYQMNSTTHQDFTLLHIFNPISNIIGLSGGLDTNLNVEIQNEYLLSFFDEHLRGESSNTEGLADKYDAVVIVNFD